MKKIHHVVSYQAEGKSIRGKHANEVVFPSQITGAPVTKYHSQTQPASLPIAKLAFRALKFVGE